jgi:hypothetical protein
VNARVYLNSSTNSATSRIDGGGFSPPSVRAYSDIILRFRLAREIEGESVPDDREVDSVTARVGYQDSAPTAGTVTLDITFGDDTVTTAALAYDATAAQVQTAINTALDGSSLDALHPATVEQREEGYFIVFNDPSQTVTVEAGSNRLWPMSFVNATRQSWDGGWATVLNYRQTAVGEAASAEETVPPVPSVTREQLGSTEDGVSINEVQKITLDPAYAGGTWRFVWDGVKGAILPGFPTVEQLQTALDALAPTGGVFTLIPIEDGVLFEFAGSMAGEAQVLMTTEEFTAPPTEWLVKIPTDTAAMRTMMAGAGTSGEIELPLDVEVTVLDDDAPEGEQKLNFPFLINFTRPVGDGTRNVSANLDYTQPLSRTSNRPFSTNSLVVGNRARRFTIGDDAATSFVLPHNLGSLTGAFTVNASTDVCTKAGHDLHNGDPVTLSTSGTLPAGLSAGGTYYVINATTDTFKLALTPNGTAVDITDTGSGTHTVTVADGTTDVVFVEVWEAAGLKRRISPEDYTVAITTDDSVTVSGFASTPTAGQYKVVVMTAGRPATYQAHTHTIAEVLLLQAALDSLNSRVTALEGSAGNLAAINAGALTSGTITQSLGQYWVIPGATEAVEAPESLVGWKPFAIEGSPLAATRLLPAVHLAAASVEALPSPLPRASATYVDRVFTTSTARTDFPGGGLLAGDHAACDGRAWYRVARIGSETSWYPQAETLELFRFAITEDELVTRSVLDLQLGIETAIFTADERPRTRRTGATWTLLVEHGVATSESSPATTGANLDDYFASPTTMLSHTFRLSEVPRIGRYGIQITRSGTGDITAVATKFFKSVACAAPASANFAIRGMLVRPDVENLPSDPRGLRAVRGFDVGADGRPDPTLGKYTIAS